MRKFGPIRMRSIISSIVKEAEKKGSFDHLPGKGKPLNLDKDLSYNPENNCIEL